MTPLRQRFIDELTRRNYAKHTIKTYVAAVARMANHFGCGPDRLTSDQLRDFQLHLIARKWLLAEADRAKRVGRIVVKGSGKGLQWRRGDRGMVT